MPRDLRMYRPRFRSPPFDVPQQQPGVHQRGDAHLGLLQAVRRRGQVGEQRGDLLGLQEIDQPDQHGLDLGRRARRR